MVSFYTPCYVEVRNSTLSTAWLLCGIGLVIGNLMLLLGQHGYAKHHSPAIDVLFWQDSAIGNGSWSWWPQLPETPASYCNMSYVQVYEADDSIWGSESIPCRRTKHSRARLFYPQSNEIGVAFSIAYGSAESDPQYNTSDIYIYEGIDLSTIAFHPSLSTVVEAIEHVPNCKALSSSGLPVQNRYDTLYPDGTYGEGLLLLSVGDIVRAAGRELDDIGSDGAPLRLSGLEIVAHVDVRNYEVPFRWPFAWNPFGWTPASQLDCTVRFKALREHFTTVRWFELREEPIAVQHGLRLTVTTTGHGVLCPVELARHGPQTLSVACSCRGCKCPCFCAHYLPPATLSLTLITSSPASWLLFLGSSADQALVSVHGFRRRSISPRRGVVLHVPPLAPHRRQGFPVPRPHAGGGRQ